MSKSYASYNGNFANAAAAIAYLLANPTDYIPGSMITCANGNLVHVTTTGVALQVTEAAPA